MESVDRLRTAARNMAKGRPLENHEDCNLLLVTADEIEAEIAEKYMRLPVDCENKPIHIGDIMDEGKVAKLVISDDGEHSVYVYKLPNVQHEFYCYETAHAKPDKLMELLNDHLQEREKIVRKLDSSLITLGEAESEEDACDKLFAERIRELMKEGGDD